MRRPRDRLRTHWRDNVFQLAWELFMVPPEKLKMMSRVREVWMSLQRLVPPLPDSG